jgi:hypothetical protein
MTLSTLPYRPARLRGVLATAATAFVLTFAIDAFIAVVYGETRGRFPTAIAPDLINLFGSRVARFEQMKQSGQVNDANLLAVLGMSTAAVGLDPKTLDAADPLHRDWLILAGRGGTFVQLEFYSRPLLQSTLHPSVVVLAIHQSMLNRGDNPIADPVHLSELPHHLLHLQLLHALYDSSWIFRNRGYALSAGNMFLYDSAHILRAAFSLPTAAEFAPEADPWSMWTEDWMDPSKLHTDPAGLDRHRQVLTGLFTQERFTGIDHQIGALHELIGELRSRGARVVLLLMPECSELRNRYPQFVRDDFATAVAGQPVTVIDQRTAIPDNQYYDLAHMNRQGCRAFSQVLPTIIQ